jgi:hypothetical protein
MKIDNPITFDQAYDLIGGLSNPSKMPWYGWSTPAPMCKTGSKLRKKEGSVCHKCYAMRGFYQMPNVKAALQRRLDAITDPKFVEAFVIVLQAFYERGKKTYKPWGAKTPIKENRFRWDDSGDFQSLAHITKVNEIALRMPHIRFYKPTKEAGLVGQWLKKNPKGFAKNLFVKVSAPMIGVSFEKNPMGLNFATVGCDADPKLFQCPALRKQGNKCLDCDACWKVGNINYPTH